MSIKTIIISAILCGMFIQATASNDTIPGKFHQVSVSLILPIDEFSGTHFAGAGISYAWSKKRFGILAKEPAKLFGLTADAGAKYFLGKKIDEAGYDFRFKNYLSLHAFGGVIFNEGRNINVRVLAGPVLGVYYGETEFGYGSMLDASYFLSEKISIGPLFNFFKHREANAQWSVGIRGGLSF